MSQVHLLIHPMIASLAKMTIDNSNQTQETLVTCSKRFNFNIKYCDLFFLVSLKINKEFWTKVKKNLNCNVKLYL